MGYWGQIDGLLNEDAGKNASRVKAVLLVQFMRERKARQQNHAEKKNELQVGNV